ncbi:MAG: tRNA (cytidine(56)-2'-O)-methyltransferase [Candidatus Peribacteraceae bacterium]|nr:tRNA (cytidine(56)-2'-O)-methyltransferase [Candidatus Peribacteraceae bacterium]
MKVTVLRLGHRAGRDPRISTHCGLVVRALGADEIIYTGEKDQGLIDSIEKVRENWGGNFKASYEKSWKTVVKNWKGKIVHLTMYGMPVQDVVKEIPEDEDLLVIVGGEKVPFEVYEKADWNIGVTNQPHSEIAALAVFLDRIFKGKTISKKFPNATKEVVPQKCGKKIIEK